MKPLKLMIAALLSLGWQAMGLAAPAPNILLILSDDVGWGSVGFQGADPDLVRTPNIDRLAAEGRRFTDASTPSSVCSPTRYAVLTGRYAWRTELKHGVLSYTSPLWIEPGRPTLASVLKERGYRTAAIGKWHLGYGTKRPVDYTQPLVPGPLEIGFDHHFGVPANHGDVTGVYIRDRQVDGLKSTRLEPFGECYYGGKPFLGLDAPQREDERVMERLTRETIHWMLDGGGAAPFFVYFNPVSAHEPVTPSAGVAGTSAAGAYGDWLHELDRSVGMLLDALDEHGLAENTLVIFTSDNGGEHKRTKSGEQQRAIEAGLEINGPWRAGKHSVFEGGFRVPLVARWPARIPAGGAWHGMVGLVDLAATLASIAGAEIPAATEGFEDSHDFAAALQGGPMVVRPPMVTHSADGVFAIREGDWKWIEGVASAPRVPGGRKDELRPRLHHLANDPGEVNDLSAERPEVTERLAKTLEEIRRAGHSRGTGYRERRPNLLIITTDDMNADSVGAFGARLKDITPNIDRFAASGMGFHRAHLVAANCMPSRNAMWSGLYPHRNRVEGFDQVPDARHRHLADVMKEAGYLTGILHKVGHSTPYAPYPGWDLVLDRRDDGSKREARVPAAYADGLMAGIRAAAAADKPFALVMNVVDPHKPFHGEGAGRLVEEKPSRVYQPGEVPVPGFLFDDPVVRAELARYYSSVRRADDSVGEMLSALEASGEAWRTVVVFLSDHGMPLPFAKTQLYHHSTHTPLVMRVPGMTSAGAEDRHHFISAVDLMPTLLELLGVDNPPPMQGRSFLPLLEGGSQDGRDFVVKQYQRNSGGADNPMRAIQTADGLYVFNAWSDGERVMATATTGTRTYRRLAELAANDSRLAERLRMFRHREMEEYYRVAKDPDCLENRIGEPSETAEIERLRSLLQQWMEDEKDPLLEVFRKRGDPKYRATFIAGLADGRRRRDLRSE
jgi:N-sulfoglucosamine sulfohydrolase